MEPLTIALLIPIITALVSAIYSFLRNLLYERHSRKSIAMGTEDPAKLMVRVEYPDGTAVEKSYSTDSEESINELVRVIKTVRTSWNVEGPDKATYDSHKQSDENIHE